jgi:hypothetical protein
MYVLFKCDSEMVLSGRACWEFAVNPRGCRFCVRKQKYMALVTLPVWDFTRSAFIYYNRPMAESAFGLC